jgi:putative flavoprotein involved in K+ transport
MVPDYVETLIVGGGQAGLTMSHMLSQRGRPRLVLERGRIAEPWRSERWEDSGSNFRTGRFGLPTFRLRTSIPTGFATSAEIITYLEAYARQIETEVRCGVADTAFARRPCLFFGASRTTRTAKFTQMDAASFRKLSRFFGAK